VKAQVITTPRADAEALTIMAWWREHRPAAPYLFEDELGDAFTLLGEHPESGRLAPRPDFPELRRVVLPKTRYYVLYELDAKQGVVWVLSVWSARRGRQPQLRRQ
jgi:plasmid stabilization system protein ParE